jgi:hypothetical protein
MVNKETRDRLIGKLEDIIDLGGEEAVDFLDKMLDMVWSELILLNLENGVAEGGGGSSF